MDVRIGLHLVGLDPFVTYRYQGGARALGKRPCFVAFRSACGSWFWPEVGPLLAFT